MIFAFDISSSKIGICVMSGNEKIEYLDTLKFVSKTSLLRRSQLFKEYCEKYLMLFVKENIRIIVEEPLISVGGGFGKVQTTGILQRFNGMTCRVLFELFQLEPEMLNVNHIRSFLGIKIPKHVDQKKKKQVIIDWSFKKFENQEEVVKKLSQKTTFGNAAVGVNDMADAIVLAVYASKNGH
jgi:hypothetical protein